MIKYTPEGYIDMGAVISAPYPFIVVVSSRGGGKTYGTLQHVIDQDLRFIYFRRTKAILEIIADPRYQPFKRLNTDRGWEIEPTSGKGLPTFVDRQDDDRIVGYAAALSTFSNVRGFDASDVDIVIWDEFIPEPHERLTFNSFSAWSNALETIGRNRELEGREPLKVVMLSNSDVIYGDVVEGFGIGDELLRMQEEGLEELEHSKDLLLVMPQLTDFKAKKADTALYRLTAATEFADVALRNKFPVEDRSHIGPQPLKEYKAVAAINGLCIYKHKSSSRWYVTTHVSGDPKRYQNNKTDLKRYIREQKAIAYAYMRRNVYFSGIDVQTRFRKIYS